MLSMIKLWNRLLQRLLIFFLYMVSLDSNSDESPLMIALSCSSANVTSGSSCHGSCSLTKLVEFIT